jgi:ectoine hydroxylase-related dioxygenase (phytanoyl-CoA dioxygenase family)
VLKPTSYNIASIADDFRRDGFVVLKKVVPRKFISEIIPRIDNMKWEEGDDWHPSYRYKNVFNRDHFWVNFIDLKPLADLAEEILGQNCHIIGETAWKSVQGHVGSPCHLDYVPHVLPKEVVALGHYHPAYIISAHIFPHTLTEELGPTKVIPGSHKWGGNFFSLDGYESVFPEPGDVLVFRSDLWHGGAPNQTADQSRYLLQVHYSQRWISQRFHPYLTWKWNEEILSKCNERQRRLLGGHKLSNYD